MGDFFKRHPLSTVIGWATTALVVLVALQGSNVLTGKAADYVNTAVGVITVVLTAYARTKVTPVIEPRNDQGVRLTPVRAPEAKW